MTEGKKRGYLRLTADTYEEKRRWSIAHIRYVEDSGYWMVDINRIDGEWWDSCAEFFDTKAEALEYATENADVVLADKTGKGVILDLELVPAMDRQRIRYFDCARRMDVRAEGDDNIRIYSDLAYNAAGAREVCLTKVQAMWLMELLPEAIASFPDHGWEGDVRKAIRRRRKEKKEGKEQ